jgi:ATP-dependent Lon protease
VSWKVFLGRLKNPTSEVKIGLVGKYVELPDAYKSISEAFIHAGATNECKVHVKYIPSESLTKDNAVNKLKGLDGVLVAPGFGSRGIEGKIEAIKYIRENNIPFFGICLGMQCAVIEFGRNVLGLKDAHSTEMNENTKDAVISMMEEQKKIIKELREINKICRIEKPYRITLLESNIPAIFKASAMKKINSLRYMEPGSGEYYKIKNWVDTFMNIPFGQNKSLPINISDGVEACHEFMENAQKTLDTAVYGLNDAKMQIMQMLGQLVTNPSALGTAIAIQGPMGTGKTTLVKEGISKILNRPFAFIALGGATDSSFLEGHSYTYEGSSWGKIVQIIIDSKCMNPVIYFDELDKISETPKGEEIAGILTHLTDTSQNSQFHDKYFAEIDFDFSKCLFIFSYNDESKVNPILRDRMYRICTKGYDNKQKTVISNQYLLPKIREQVKFEAEDITIADDVINYIIENYCNKEDGVRNMKRCLEIIYTKLNLYRLMKPGSNLFEKEMALKVEFPFKVTKDVVDKLIKNDKRSDDMALRGMYC